MSVQTNRKKRKSGDDEDEGLQKSPVKKRGDFGEFDESKIEIISIPCKNVPLVDGPQFPVEFRSAGGGQVKVQSKTIANVSQFHQKWIGSGIVDNEIADWIDPDEPI